MTQTNITTVRIPLGDICDVPDDIISVYSLEKHIWANSNSDKAIRERKPELKTIEEFQIDPVRPFLNDILRNMAAPYNPTDKTNPVGQGYWIQAEFGSGKSHLMCFLGALALGSEEAWNLIKEKEEKANRGRRESLYYFWENGVKKKNETKKGVFVVAKTLVGSGGGTIGTEDAGRRFVEYVLDATKNQIQKELGKNISLYPVELLVDRFLQQDLDRYRNDLRNFLKDQTYFADDETEDITEFIQQMQEDRSPEYKRSVGNKLWRFYTDYLKVKPDIAAETEDILRHLVQSVLEEGYSGVLFLIDEVSLFMKDRNESRQIDDEKTLVVLSNRLAKVENLPVWTVCAAQQAIESRTAGTKNIIADDRLKLVPLLQQAEDYYKIVLSRVREIKNPEAIAPYFNYYKRGFSWPNHIGSDEFERFFPFHKTSIELLRDITHELTTARSAIHFMHQTLKHAIKTKSNELIRLWDFFDDALEYEEDPSGSKAGLVAIKTRKDKEYKIYEGCKQFIDDQVKGPISIYREKAVKILQILFLYYIARRKEQGLSAEEIANEILIEKDSNVTLQENVDHYDYIASNLKRELRQVAETKDETGKSLYRFIPEHRGINPLEEFERVKSDIQNNEHLRNEAWNNLLALHEWTLNTGTMTLNLSNNQESIFYEFAPNRDAEIAIYWQNGETLGKIMMRDTDDYLSGQLPIPVLNSSETDHDFLVIVGKTPLESTSIDTIISNRKDPRIILWTPGEPKLEEQDLLVNFATYRKMINDWNGKQNDDAKTIIDWVSERLQNEISRIIKSVSDRYQNGRIDAWNHTNNSFSMIGNVEAILSPVIEKILSSMYESKVIQFPSNPPFNRDDAIKVINGIVTKGEIPKEITLRRNESAAQNFGSALMITDKSNWRKLDISQNPFTNAIWDFIDTKLPDAMQTIDIETIYKNFMGINGLNGKHYGLSKPILQIYLLCLVKMGKIKFTLSQKAGLSSPLIDYSNLQDVEFSARIISGLDHIQKMVKPENWEVLRPYLEVLLNTQIPLDIDDAKITEFRKEIKDHCRKEKENSESLIERLKILFETIGIKNPYEDDIKKIKVLYAQSLGDNEIDGLLYALQQSLNYKAFQEQKSNQKETEDLKIRINNYRNLQQFITYEKDLSVLDTYAKYPYPNIPELEPIIQNIELLTQKITNIKPYIDSSIKLRTELIGDSLKITGDPGTLYYIIQTYTPLYKALHQNAISKITNNKNIIRTKTQSTEWKVILELQKIPALHPKNAASVENTLSQYLGQIFTCSTPSSSSIESKLKSTPEHDCNLSFSNYEEKIETSNNLQKEATTKIDATIKETLSFFLNQSIKDRLKQGSQDPDIKKLLECNNEKEIMQYFLNNPLNINNLILKINKYLKEIKIKTVKLSDFEPSQRTIEESQIEQISKEFKEYLKKQMEEVEKTKDTLPMIQIE